MSPDVATCPLGKNRPPLRTTLLTERINRNTIIYNKITCISKQKGSSVPAPEGTAQQPAAVPTGKEDAWDLGEDDQSCLHKNRKMKGRDMGGR